MLPGNLTVIKRGVMLTFDFEDPIEYFNIILYHAIYRTVQSDVIFYSQNLAPQQGVGLLIFVGRDTGIICDPQGQVINRFAHI